MLTMSPKKTMRLLWIYLFLWTFTGLTWSCQSDRLPAVLGFEEKRVERRRVIRAVGTQSVEQGPGEQSVLNRILKRDSDKGEKNKSGNTSPTDSGCSSKNSRAIGFDGQVIGRIRMLIDDLQNDPTKVINQIWND
jgi:hypothetical protein